MAAVKGPRNNTSDMVNIENLMLLLPVIFMIHEYEEIIRFKGWLDQNRMVLQQRFPSLYHFLLRNKVFEYSTETFAIGTALNFLLISLVTIISLSLGAYHLWFVALIGHTLHLTVHILQWLIYRRYIPVIFTSLITLPYCAYAGIAFVTLHGISALDWVIYISIGFLAMLLSFTFAFLVMKKVNERLTNGN